MQETKKTDKRNASLDVLRCLLMFGVVLQHTFAVCKFGGVVAYSSYAIVDCLTHPSVDGFTSISGWFGVRCTLKKLWRLSCLIFFCGTLHWFIYEIGRQVCGSWFSCRYGIDLPYNYWGYESYRYWYLGAYVKLMVATILLNPLFDLIAKLRRHWIWLIATAFVGLNYLSKLWFPWVSHSPRTIIFVYIVVRFAMMLGFKEYMQKVKSFRVGAIIALVGVFGLIAANAHWHLGLNFGNYASPLTMLAGLLMVGVFDNLDFRCVWGGQIREGMFIDCAFNDFGLYAPLEFYGNIFQARSSGAPRQGAFASCDGLCAMCDRHIYCLRWH